jgi:vacuolar iron transporter family protein
MKTESRVELHRHIRGRSFVAKSALGLADGLVTNLAFLSGLAGSAASIGLIRFAGAAAVIAGAVSMFFAGVLAGRSERDLFQADVRRESTEIEVEPDEEKRELQNFYEVKGLTHAEAEMVVDKIAADKKKFLEDLMIHELHVSEATLENPYKSGVVIGGSFLAGALMPLGPYLFLANRNDAVIVSLIVAFTFLFLVGGWKGRIVGRRFWKSGVETLIVGVAASGILYFIGSLLGFF